MNAPAPRNIIEAAADHCPGCESRDYQMADAIAQIARDAEMPPGVLLPQWLRGLAWAVQISAAHDMDNECAFKLMRDTIADLRNQLAAAHDVIGVLQSQIMPEVTLQ